MKTFCTIIQAGMLALVVSGTALAHDSGHHDVYRNDGLYGSATVWGDSSGHIGYAGTLRYGAGYGYSPAYISWAARAHGPRCHHGPGHGYGHGYKHGYKKGRKHGRKHHNRQH